MEIIFNTEGANNFFACIYQLTFSVISSTFETHFSVQCACMYVFCMCDTVYYNLTIYQLDHFQDITTENVPQKIDTNKSNEYHKYTH